MMLVYGMLLFLTCNLGLLAIQRFDKTEWMLRQKELVIIIGSSGVNAMIIAQFVSVREWEKLLLAVVAGCLLLACITDCRTCEVYQFTWWIAGIAGMIWLFISVAETDLCSLLFYCLLQELLFCKFYGKADSHAFVVCALVLYGMGGGFLDCILHMLSAFCCLTVVQILRHNVNRKGNLKRAVAFLPYITVSFWINLCCFSHGKMVY